MKNYLTRIAFLIISAVTALAGQTYTAHADDSILVLYNDRAPYMVTGPGGDISGLTADPAKFAFTKSGIPHHFESAPTKRQMEAIEASEAKVCIIGWFKNPEREKIGKFTDALYKDKATVAIAKADNTKIDSGKTVDAVLSDKNLTVLVKEGFSYGAFIDDKIKQLSPKREDTLLENVGMLKMILAGRADYMFIAPEEAEVLMKSADFKAGDFKLVTFTNMPEGGNRYLLCSRLVPDADIQKLNAALKEYRDSHPQK